MSRPFNSDAYKSCDMPAKLMLRKIIELNSNYRLVGDITTEYYKSHDLEFLNSETIEFYLKMRFMKILMILLGNI